MIQKRMIFWAAFVVSAGLAGALPEPASLDGDLPYARDARVCDRETVAAKAADQNVRGYGETISKGYGDNASGRFFNTTCSDVEVAGVLFVRLDGDGRLVVRVKVPAEHVGVAGAEVALDPMQIASRARPPLQPSAMGNPLWITDYHPTVTTDSLVIHRLDLALIEDGSEQERESYRYIVLEPQVATGDYLATLDHIGLGTSDDYMIAVYLTALDEASGNAVFSRPAVVMLEPAEGDTSGIATGAGAVPMLENAPARVLASHAHQFGFGDWNYGHEWIHRADAYYDRDEGRWVTPMPYPLWDRSYSAEDAAHHPWPELYAWNTNTESLFFRWDIRPNGGWWKKTYSGDDQKQMGGYLHAFYRASTPRSHTGPASVLVQLADVSAKYGMNCHAAPSNSDTDPYDPSKAKTWTWMSHCTAHPPVGYVSFDLLDVTEGAWLGTAEAWSFKDAAMRFCAWVFCGGEKLQFEIESERPPATSIEFTPESGHRYEVRFRFQATVLPPGAGAHHYADYVRGAVERLSICWSPECPEP